MPRQRYKVWEYDLPVPQEIAANIRRAGSSLSELAVQSESACRDRLRAEWSGLENPASRRFAEYLLSLPSTCLSEYQGKGYWLTFSNGDQRLSIVAAKNPPPSRELGFPLDAVAGLEEFLTCFGGVTDWNLPPGSCFATTGELVVIRKENNDWGMIEGWEGSLLFYFGGTGDRLLVRADGATGKWSHDDAWEDSGVHAIQDLEASFSELISRYLDYCQMMRGSEEQKASPFYY